MDGRLDGRDRARRPVTWPRSPVFVSRPRWALAIGTALLGIAVLMAIFLPAEPLRLDRRWAEAMHDVNTAFLTHVALVFNALGHGVGRLLSIAAVAVLLAVVRRWVALAAFLVVEALCSVGSTLLKDATDRPRPPDSLVHPSGSSFPSGHAAYAGATCVALVLLFTSPGRRRLWWSLAAIGIAAMAWSRTYLQVHWLSDVAGGAALGIAISLVTFAGAQWWAGLSYPSGSGSTR
jgi:membrane-associated phospholipid phosphatase